MPTLAAVAVGVSALVRAYLVRLPPLSFDEAFSWRLSRFPASELIARSARGVHPPAYYLLLKGWTVLFPETPGSMRMLSVLIGAAAGMWVYLLLDTALKSPSASALRSCRGFILVLSTALVAAHPLLTRHSMDARVYPLTSLMALVGAWALLKALRGPDNTRYWATFAVVSAINVYTNTWCLFVVAGQLTFWAGWCLAESRRSGVSVWRVRQAKPGLFAAAAVAILYAPWLPVLSGQPGKVVRDFNTSALTCRGFAEELAYTFTALDWIDSAPFPPLWCALSAAVLILLAASRAELDALLLGSVAVPVGLAALTSLLLGRSLLTSRLIYPCVPFLMAGVGVLIARIPEPMLRTATAALALSMTVGLTTRFVIQADAAGKPGLLAVARVLGKRWAPGDQIFVYGVENYLSLQVYAKQFGFTPPHLLRETKEALSYYRGGPVVDPDEVMVPEEAAAIAADRAWVVESRLGARYWTPIPAGWTRVEETQFPETDLGGRGMVFLDLIGCRRPEGVGTARSPSHEVHRSPGPIE